MGLRHGPHFAKCQRYIYICLGQVPGVLALAARSKTTICKGEAMETKAVKTEIRYFAKKSCKQCYGRGSIIRTLPRGRKRQVAQKFRCPCVREEKPIHRKDAENAPRTESAEDKKEDTGEDRILNRIVQGKVGIEVVHDQENRRSE